MHANWWVLIIGNKIAGVGEADSFTIPSDTKIIELKNKTILPGLIEGHSHLFLHPYNETSWDDQVLNESRTERTARAVNHAIETLMAGFTTIRYLGTEGAMYDDAGLKQSIEKGIIPGPGMLVATRAIVATGSYGPKSTSAEIDYPKGAAEAGGTDALIKEIRTQIGKGADLIKLYADYRWGMNKEARPTFSAEELKLAVQTANSSGIQVVVHSVIPEGMRRSIMAGVSTIEHGDFGTTEIFQLMKETKIALCPTLAAGYFIEQYKGWKPGLQPEPERILQKRKSFKAALDAGVTICMGGDVGVFSHGKNWMEMELMVEYGMKPMDVLRSATSVNADVFEISDKVGRIKKGLLADIIAVDTNPLEDIKTFRFVSFVMKNGVIYKK
ncbi:MAG: amidohydrolase family protein [Sphingobacteriales bacterium]|nr:amidohydrolase family protein [Sphingobacteriales bacterium]